MPRPSRFHLVAGSLFSLLLLLPLGAAADHALRAGAAVRAATVREDLLVPLAFSGAGLRLDFGYDGQVGPGLLSARLELGARPLWNRYGHFAAGIDYALAARWLLPVHEGAGWRVAVGPAAAEETSVHYLASWDDAHAYWLGARWLGPAARFAFALGEVWRLEASPSIALVGVRSRPPTYRYAKQDALDRVGFYFEAPHRAPTFFTAADTQLVRLDLALRQRALHESDVASGWTFGLDSRLRRASLPQQTIELETSLYAARSWEL